jgi:cytochrome c oxidase subunit II
MSDSGKPAGDDYLLKVDNPLVVPVDQKIRIVTTANDVIHAWMVPAFGVKQDAIPGFVRDTWFRAEKTGDFYGQCAELCGKEHAYMPIHVKVLSAEDYAKWVDGKRRRWPPGRRPVQGLDAGRPGRARREGLRRQLRRLPPGPTARAPARSRRWTAAPSCWSTRQAQIADPAQRQANGAMPAWKQLSDTELAAVMTYTKNAWSNKTGKLVQPAEVVAARK